MKMLKFNIKNQGKKSRGCRVSQGIAVISQEFSFRRSWDKWTWGYVRAHSQWVVPWTQKGGCLVGSPVRLWQQHMVHWEKGKRQSEGRPSELLGPKAENCHRMFLKGVKYSKLDFTMIKAGIVWRCQAWVTGKLVVSLTQNENMKMRFYVERDVRF